MPKCDTYTPGEVRAFLAHISVCPVCPEVMEGMGDPETEKDIRANAPILSTTGVGGRSTISIIPGPGGASGEADRPSLERLAELAKQGPRFLILRAHKKGGIGDIFVAQDCELGREVALKRLQEEKADVLVVCHG